MKCWYCLTLVSGISWDFYFWLLFEILIHFFRIMPELRKRALVLVFALLGQYQTYTCIIQLKKKKNTLFSYSKRYLTIFEFSETKSFLNQNSESYYVAWFPNWKLFWNCEAGCWGEQTNLYKLKSLPWFQTSYTVNAESEMQCAFGKCLKKSTLVVNVKT